MPFRLQIIRKELAERAEASSIRLTRLKKIREEFFNLTCTLFIPILIGITPFLINYLFPATHLNPHIALSSALFLQFALFPFLIIYLSLSLINDWKLKSPSKRIPFGLPHKILVAFISLLIFLQLLVIIPYSAFRVFGTRDIPPAEYSDLCLSKVEIAPERNAFTYIMEASRRSSIDNPNVLINLLKANGNSREVRQVLMRNEALFPYVEKALSCPYFQPLTSQDPEKIDPITTFPEYREISKIARLCILKARNLFAQGKQKEGMDWLLKVLKLGDMVENAERPMLITYVIGREIKETALSQMRQFLPKTQLPVDFLKISARTLLKLEPRGKTLRKVAKMEFTIGEKTLSTLERAAHNRFLFKEMKEKWKWEEWEPSLGFLLRLMRIPGYYKPNLTRKIYADVVYGFIENIEKSYKDQDLAKVQLPTLRSSKLRSLYWPENNVGIILLYQIVPEWRNTLREICFQRLSLRSTACLLALKAYKDERGRLPESLRELVPGYLPYVPLDPFDGNQLRYSKEKRVIYSLGEDLKDSGGIGEKDPGFKVEF